MNEKELEELITESDAIASNTVSVFTGAQVRQSYERRRSRRKRLVAATSVSGAILAFLGVLWQVSVPNQQAVAELNLEPAVKNQEMSDSQDRSTSSTAVDKEESTLPKLDLKRIQAELEMQIAASRREQEAAELRQSIAKLQSNLDEVRRESRDTELQLLFNANQLASSGRDAELQELISLAPNSLAFKKYSREEL